MKKPFRHNTDWVVSTEHDYIPRGVAESVHIALARHLVERDPELFALQDTLGYPIVIRVEVGLRTVHLRVYNRDDVLTRPDQLASRCYGPDAGVYLDYGLLGVPTPQLTVVSPEHRQLAQGHVPKLYAVRRLTTKQIQGLNELQQRLVHTHTDEHATPSLPLSVSLV